MDLFLNFSVLDSAALIGLLSLTLPILIHLFNPNRGKTILIGNIDFIKKHTRIRMIEMRIRQWILLFVRLIILLILTLILSNLIKNVAPELPDKTNIFISPDWLNKSTEIDRAKLITEHSQDDIFLITTRFPKLSTQYLKAFTNKKTSNNSNKNTPLSINAFVAEMQNLDLFAKQNILYSTSNMAQYQKEYKAILDPERFQWRIKSIAPANDQTIKMNIDIYFSHSRKLDSQYLELALDTLAGTTGLALDIRTHSYTDIINNPSLDENVRNNIHWIFWLSEDPIPGSLKEDVSNGSYLLTDVYGNLNNIEKNQLITIIKVNDFLAQFYTPLPREVLPQFTPVWHDQSGHIALSFESTGLGKVFRFNSRFHHKWTNLVTSIHFPKAMSQLLKDHPKLNSLNQLSESELNSFMFDKENIPVTNKNTSYRSLLIFLLCLFWLLERFISARSKPSDE